MKIDKIAIHEAIFYYSLLIAHVVVGVFVSFFDDYQRKLMMSDIRNFFKRRERHDKQIQSHSNMERDLGSKES